MTLPVVPAHRLDARPPEAQWLIDGLWAREGVGIVGGEPKCCKSFLALDLAVSVASGVPCLGRFRASQTGRVLLYAAEDGPHIVRARLDGVCKANDIDLADLDIQVVTAPPIRLDFQADRVQLGDTVEQVKPRLLILDPFVRLHGVDENNSGEIAPLLGFLRGLQRVYHVAIIVVHHAKKGAKKARPGQALRGTSEFHAWGDSNLFMRREGDQLTLSVEHRAAPPIPPLQLRLEAGDGCLALRPREEPRCEEIPPRLEPREAILAALRAASHPLTPGELKSHCRVRNSTFRAILSELEEGGFIIKTAGTYLVSAA